MNRRGVYHSSSVSAAQKGMFRKTVHLIYVSAYMADLKKTIMSKQRIIKIIISVLIAALTALGAAFGLSSCNVTRTVTTKSEYWQRADTSVVIQTKTIETYDASKKL